MAGGRAPTDKRNLSFAPGNLSANEQMDHNGNRTQQSYSQQSYGSLPRAFSTWNQRGRMDGTSGAARNTETGDNGLDSSDWTLDDLLTGNFGRSPQPSPVATQTNVELNFPERGSGNGFATLAQSSGPHGNGYPTPSSSRLPVPFPNGLSEILRQVLGGLTRISDNVLIQLWLPSTGANGQRVLHTKNSPYVIMGVGDMVGSTVPPCSTVSCC
jgi:hypothetical protein